MSLDSDAARRAVLVHALSAIIDELYADLREAIAADLLPGERAAAVEGDQQYGYVQVTNPQPRLSVVDWGALAAWVAEHHPDAIVTSQTVNRSTVQRIIRDGGVWVDKATGEVTEVPGLGTTRDAPQLRVTLADAAKARARRALAGLALPALTTGDDQ